MVKISPEWVTGPEQGKSSGRIATFNWHKEIYKFTWEARGHKSIIDYFITNIKTSKIFQDIRVYSSNEIVSEHYLLCQK